MQPNKPVVLVVDDDPVNLDILVQTLEQDYFLIIAKNGKRALDLAFSHHPDLILLDILMPEMDGFEVCQRLKADKETEGIPVIFLSVMESPGQKHRGFEVGGVDYVTKPFHADEVLARVRTHITNKRLREELESHNMLIGMELHEKSRQLETLMNNLPGLAYQGEHSPDRKVRFVSQGVTRLTGYTPEHFMGPDGMAQAAEQSMAKAHYLAKELCAIDGVELVYTGDFFHEFVTRLPERENVLAALAQADILGGLPLGGDGILWCATEKQSRAELDKAVSVVKEVLAK